MRCKNTMDGRGVYTCQRCLDGTNVEFEVWDTAGQNENSKLKEQIRWADAIILIYDVTDRCSFNECSQLKFLTQELSRRAKQKYFTDTRSESLDHLPVVLVGNKIDKEVERMVSYREGETKSRQLNCVAFRELSVSETVQGVTSLFEELYLYCRSVRKLSPHHASTSRLNLLADQLATCSSSVEDLAERKSIQTQRGAVYELTADGAHHVTELILDELAADGADHVTELILDELTSGGADHVTELILDELTADGADHVTELILDELTADGTDHMTELMLDELTADGADHVTELMLDELTADGADT
ncbi:hypothetical protein Btru_078016 [Bulinus truncatus]|nr:hypothetical protein Btru_078016 [Bulinus truncatus]